MKPAQTFELVLALLAAVIGLELLARRLRLPPAAMLIVGGIALALIPGVPQVTLDPDLTMVLFLPPLLLAGAYFTVWRDFRADLRIILQLAVGAVLFTTAVVGVVAHGAVPALPWAACFALGAIVSPPDAVAAKAVLHGLRLPARIVVLLEGESLVNDATGLVLYRFAVAATLTGTFSVGHAAASFGVLAVGGVAFGLACGWLTTIVLARLHDPHLSIVASLLAAWGSYIAADALGVSGVLATVVCGLVMGWRQHATLSAEVRMRARAVWDASVFVFESLVFILIGLSLRGVASRIDGGWASAGAIGAVVAAVVLSRFAWILPVSYLSRALFPSIRRRDPWPGWSVPIMMSWAGMRGVVSIAVALALPENFPQRDFILAATFAVVCFTVLVQGATLAPLIRRLHFGGKLGGAASTMDEAAARARVAQAQFEAVERRSRAEDGTQRHPRLIEQYGHRARAKARFSETGGALSGARNEHFGVVLAAVEAGRAELLRLHHEGDIHDTVLHTLEHELDLEELGARPFAADA